MDNFENYQVTSIIGSGSFGTCYKVRHKTSLKEFVWKAVNYGEMTEQKKQLLVSEVNLLSKLRHPNIVSYYDHIIHHKSSILYIIMECCSGGDLSKVIKHCAKTALQLEELFVWRVLYQIASALNVCHSQCASVVLHRDIKPANIFLDAEHNVKLGDFGLAKILEDKQSFASTIVGTPLYMSPEVVRNKQYNKKSDIWALGCVVYEACALTPAFNGRDICHLSEQIKIGGFARIPDHYSEDLHKMIRFLLNTDSESRPAVDIILRHPTVLTKSSKTIKSIYRKVSASDPCMKHGNLDANFETKFNENLLNRLENVRNREAALKLKEDRLNEKERELARREKKVALMERLANEKTMRANLHLKRSKETKTPGNSATLGYARNYVRPKPAQSLEELDTSFSADAGDNSILPTSTKIDEENIVRPKGFVRSKSERKVHFNARKIFQTNPDDVVFKEYNFFSDQNNIENDIKDTQKSKKKSTFGLTVFKNWNSKMSQSNSSLGSKSSKSSSNNSEVASRTNRPVSWTEENKKSAFTLLKLMNAECDKENVHSKVPHTKM